MKMDIYNYLKKDHRKVEELMAQIIAARSPQRRKELFNEMKYELSLHSDTEEATFYAALERAAGEEREEQTEDKMEHAHEEHDEVREYLAKLSRMSVESERWMEQFGELKHAVEHHVKEEEEDIFEKAKQLLSDEDAVLLARKMDQLKQERNPHAA